MTREGLSIYDASDLSDLTGSCRVALPNTEGSGRKIDDEIKTSLLICLCVCVCKLLIAPEATRLIVEAALNFLPSHLHETRLFTQSGKKRFRHKA